MKFFERLLQHRNEQADVFRKPYDGDLKGLPFPLTRERKAILRKNTAPVYIYSASEDTTSLADLFAVQGNVAR